MDNSEYELRGLFAKFPILIGYLRKVSIACSDLYADLVGYHKQVWGESGGFCAQASVAACQPHE